MESLKSGVHKFYPLFSIITNLQKLYLPECPLQIVGTILFIWLKSLHVVESWSPQIEFL